jgi:hypothetical protein
MSASEKEIHRETRRLPLRMQERASRRSLLTVFVPALRKLPAGGRPIMAHTLQLNRFIHQSLCQHKKFVWQTPLIMDTFLQQLLVES